MDSFGNAEDRDVFGNSTNRDVFGNPSNSDVLGNPPSDVFGNYDPGSVDAGDGPWDALGDLLGSLFG